MFYTWQLLWFWAQPSSAPLTAAKPNWRNSPGCTSSREKERIPISLFFGEAILTSKGVSHQS